MRARVNLSLTGVLTAFFIGPMTENSMHSFGLHAPLWKRLVTVALLATAFADVLTVALHLTVKDGGLLTDLALVSAVSLVVATPLAAIFSARTVHLEKLTLELARAASTDSLTNLPNRIGFNNLCNEAMRIATLNHVSAGSLLFIDVDHFKRINDTQGHAGGDEVLKMIGRVLRATCRFGDVMGRIGGEEFAVFLPGAGNDEAVACANRIRKAIREASPEGKPPVTVSIGIGVHEPGQRLETVMDAADDRLYAAKRNGKDRTEAPYRLAAAA